YGAILHEGGKNLSGGQRQKIALARTFVRNSTILILDEPTNSLDGETELIMQNNIKEFYNDKTLILATHKPSILQLVDRVLIVVDGKIIADGPRDEVLSNFTKKTNGESQ
ncbi:MAG: ATP-binding cassette domain-containing protein, partial [Pseudomonadota bacterium]|nr:ATP-binding cassette domain-containing protein [Pseudomonadota bacterium]